MMQSNQNHINAVSNNLETKLVPELESLHQFLNHLPYYTMLLDENRKLLASNDQILNDLNLHDVKELFGKGPGDIFQCENAEEAGCGNSSNCKFCGIYKTLNDCLNSKLPTKHVSRLMVNRNHKLTAYEFTANCSSISIENKFYFILTLIDIRAENRKLMLEKIFFHDVLNIINGQYGLVQIISDLNNQRELFEYIDCLHKITENLTSTITDQRDLNSAENNELIVKEESVSVEGLITSIIAGFSLQNQGEIKKIQIKPSSHDFTLNTDPYLLTRILTNMIKNALEADNSTHFITLSYSIENEIARFSVNNMSFISKEVSRNIFMPMYSTKGNSRGLGTYSMRLIGENYLNGNVYFSTHPDKGTTFSIDLPFNKNI